MNIETIREYCLSLPNVTQTTPFDDIVLVYKVGLKNGKSRMFALTALDNPDYLAVKCDPELAVELRERFPESVEGAWHFNKTHWNGIHLLANDLSNTQIEAMIAHSYELVSLSKGQHPASAEKLRALFEL